MLINLIGSILFVIITILAYSVVNVFALLKTLLWNHRAFKQYWPEWGIDAFGESLCDAIAAPWERTGH